MWRPSFWAALDAVDSVLPFMLKATVMLPPAPLANVFLCIVSLAASCVFPMLVDLSKTARAFGPDGLTEVQLPYTPLSVLRAEATFNVVLGVFAIAVRRSPGGFAPLLHADLHLQILPLTLIYVLGDIATLFSIGQGGGPLYMAVSNSRLIVAAGVSHCLVGRRQTLRQWLLLAEITLATAAYATLSAGGGSGGGDANALRTAAGACWAVLKAFLSGTAAVLTESRYKTLDLWHANTLLKMQSLAVAVIVGTLPTPLSSEQVPLCGSAEAASAAWCIDRQGWDRWTWAVLTAEIGTGWLSVAVLTRMSAITKFICKTATAPSLYLLYCINGIHGFRFKVPSFIAVVMMAVGIFLYALEPLLDKRRRTAAKRNSDKTWAGHYAQWWRGPA